MHPSIPVQLHTKPFATLLTLPRLLFSEIGVSISGSSLSPIRFGTYAPPDTNMTEAQGPTVAEIEDAQIQADLDELNDLFLYSHSAELLLRQTAART